MAKPARRIFTAEFKLEAAQCVTQHGYSVIEASKVSPLTPEKIEIRALNNI